MNGEQIQNDGPKRVHACGNISLTKIYIYNKYQFFCAITDAIDCLVALRHCTLLPWFFFSFYSVIFCVDFLFFFFFIFSVCPCLETELCVSVFAVNGHTHLVTQPLVSPFLTHNTHMNADENEIFACVDGSTEVSTHANGVAIIWTATMQRIQRGRGGGGERYKNELLLTLILLFFSFLPFFHFFYFIF